MILTSIFIILPIELIVAIAALPNRKVKRILSHFFFNLSKNKKNKTFGHFKVKEILKSSSTGMKPHFQFMPSNYESLHVLRKNNIIKVCIIALYSIQRENEA